MYCTLFRLGIEISHLICIKYYAAIRRRVVGRTHRYKSSQSNFLIVKSSADNKVSKPSNMRPAFKPAVVIFIYRLTLSLVTYCQILGMQSAVRRYGPSSLIVKLKNRLF